MSESTALVVAESVALGTLRANDASGMLAGASAIATPLAKFIKDRKLAVSLQGRDYVKCEGWTTLSAMLGVTPHEVSVEERDGVFVATVELRRLSDGQAVSRASAECGSDDEIDRFGKPTWSGRPRYARRSMALTRATAKAARLAFSWVMTLAGYEATPYEEMEPVIEAHPTPAQTAAVRQAAVRTAQKAADAAPVIDAEASVAEAPDHDLLGDVEPAETIPPGAAELGAVRVQDAKVLKKGEGAKGPWTLFLLKFSDGREATTFDEPTYAAGTVSLKDRSLVIADTRPSKRDATKLELVSLMKVG